MVFTIISSERLEEWKIEPVVLVLQDSNASRSFTYTEEPVEILEKRKQVLFNVIDLYLASGKACLRPFLDRLRKNYCSFSDVQHMVFRRF